MDPNATLEVIETELENRMIEPTSSRDESIKYFVEDLREWIQSEGFEPDWKAYPLATQYYHKTKNS